MDDIFTEQTITIRQNKEWGQILTGFETRNSYNVFGAGDREICRLGETGGSFFLRTLLMALRPFHIDVTGPGGGVVLTLDRSFTFYFHTVSVTGPGGTLIGRIRRQFSLLERIYSVEGPAGEEIGRIVGPLFHPWTFNIFRGGQPSGKIVKRWSGLGKEMFTDADNYTVEFPPDANGDLKALLLGATILIDFVHFENKSRS